MVANPFNPNVLVGRQAELKQVCAILAVDGDLLLAGVPGSGRRRLVRQAAEMVGARVMQIDCLRATHSQKLLALLAEEIAITFADVLRTEVLQSVFATQSVLRVSPQDGSVQWTVEEVSPQEWQVFQALLALPQAIAEALCCRVVIVFQNFPHLRTWDRGEVWERYLRQEIQRQSQVSYALIATIAESWIQSSDIQVMCLGPIPPEEMEAWFNAVTTVRGWGLEAAAIALFLDAVQGNMGTAIAVLRRLWIDWILSPTDAASPSAELAGRSQNQPQIKPLITAAQMQHSLFLLVEDLALTFEALLLLLPASQVRVLESLALDPTDTPHSREYTQKHHLSRGGGLQGALASLQQKGLVYGADYGYRIAIPLLALWLKHRLV